MSDSPPSSYYDPPADSPYEINDERAPIKDSVCDRCDEVAFRTVEIRDMRIRYGCGGSWHDLCEHHYESALEDYIKDIENYRED